MKLTFKLHIDRRSDNLFYFASICHINILKELFSGRKGKGQEGMFKFEICKSKNRAKHLGSQLLSLIWLTLRRRACTERSEVFRVLPAYHLFIYPVRTILILKKILFSVRNSETCSLHYVSFNLKFKKERTI